MSYNYSTPYSSIPPERHELNDFYDSSSVPAPHRLSQNLTPSQSYTDIPNQYGYMSGPDPTTQLNRPSISGDGNYRDSYASSFDKEAHVGGGGYGYAAGAGGAAGAGAAYGAATAGGGGAGGLGYAHYDPQGRSGARFAARQEQGATLGGTGAASGGYAAAAGGTGGSKKKWWIIGGIVLAIAAIVAIAVGVIVGRNGGGSGSSSNKSAEDGSADVGDDPSVFEKDSRLHNSFWAFAYTPQNVQYGTCGATQANVTRDVQILSQLTTRIRLYGANCNQTAMVLQAIQDTKVDLSVYVAIYVDSNQDAFDSQLEAIEDALKTYGADHVLGVTVGNEYILFNGAAGIPKIVNDVATVRARIDALGLSKTLPHGTSDAGSVFTQALAEGIDYFHANVHPWFGNLSIADAATWTWDFYQTNDVAVAESASNKPDTAIAETGWPTGSDWANTSSNGGGAEASAANLQTFLDTFVCQANANGTHYFFFEAFDEPWKRVFGGVEPHWGVFDEHRNLKDLTLPTCSHD
ncbi:glycoside hydrolase superfamily [Filobasidium floriforme]|uniref:glycoside hydrolase superfamily n=1 Tax=Filobasidium floriforme TaxID=5210 RepID=UPI001E8E467A|nr:glycoside hydrolase superfamily [Filobasidium floriforme]KAH8082585.1 glycoside hydrolase superfamily [Filobasidium floriforme]